MFDNSDAPSLELLRFRPDFAQVPGFETALREQVRRLGEFRHPAFAAVRSVQRLEPDDDLALVSNCTPGKRLSDVLHQARGPAYAAALIRQLAPALVLLQQHDAGISHGVLSPDRIVVSPEGRLTIVEHVVGPAIETLNLRTVQLASIGIALPPTARGATPRLDVATDWYQLGLVAVSVLIGRPVTANEVPQLETLLDDMGDSAGPDGTRLSPFMRQWLDRALQISGNRIESGADASAALEELLQSERTGESRRVESRRQPQRPRPIAAPPVEAEPVRHPTPEPVRPLADEPSTSETPAPSEARQHPVQVRTLFGQEPFAVETPHADRGREAAFHESPAATRAPLNDPHAAARPRPGAVARRAISTSLVVALALIAAVEAGAIAWLARALWRAPHPAIVVETAASGENVLVSRRSTDAAPLRLTVAPDLRWVRVNAPSSAGVLGWKATDTRAGTIRISSPIELKVLKQARLLGSVPGADLKVPAGRHDIELVNAALGYRSQQTIDVEAGQTVSIHVAPPPGWVTVDASPWADVSIDGQAVGRTPLGPLPLAPGEHQVAFRHPAGGSDRQRVTVKSEAKMRVIGVLRP